jgi:hypothetical protein
MRVLWNTIPLVAAIVLGATQVRAETSVDRAEDAFHSCVADFARSLVLNSPLDVDAIEEQSLRSCDATLEAFRRVLTETPEKLPSEVQVRLAVSQSIARELVGLLWDKVKTQPRRMNEDDVGIWMNPGLTEAETAETRRPRLILRGSGHYLPQL